MNSNHDSHNTYELSAEEREHIVAWANSPAPGEERIRNFAPPGPKLHRPRNHWRWMYQAAAAVLLFAAGYLAGTAGQASSAIDEARPIAAVSTPTHVQTPASEPVPGSNVPPTPAIASASSPQKEDCPAPQIYQGSDGHFRIDTTLCETGSRATWVINPKLELASAPNSKPEEKQ